MNILSVPSPLRPGSNSTLFYYDIRNRLPTLESCLDSHGGRPELLNPGILTLYTLVTINAMRISEALALRGGDEYTPTMWAVKGLKHSRDYTIHIPISKRNRTILENGGESFVLFPFTYQRVWRNLVTAGLSVLLPGHKHRTVTHRGRFNLVSQLNKPGNDTNVSDLLRHNNPKSKRYYEI